MAKIKDVAIKAEEAVAEVKRWHQLEPVWFAAGAGFIGGFVVAHLLRWLL